MAEKKLYLLDAFALIYRAHFAFARNPRFNSKGMNTSAIFGFTNSLLEVLNNQKPTHIGVVFDTPGVGVREEIFTEYKANRDKMPEDIQQALDDASKERILSGDSFDSFEFTDDSILESLRLTPRDFRTFAATPVPSPIKPKRICSVPTKL